MERGARRGINQRLRAATPEVATSKLGAYLLKQWSSGVLPAIQVQILAACAVADGCAHVDLHRCLGPKLHSRVNLTICN
eukprot:1166816-Amphidinium_carterae.1